MNTSAIDLAIRLYKHPNEMSWLCQPDSVLPEGITDLLRLSASSKQVDQYISENHIDKDFFIQSLTNFINQVILNDKNSREKQLGISVGDPSDQCKLHYQLLMKIYHPDHNNSLSAHAQASAITKNYQSLKSMQSLQNDDSNYVNVTFTTKRKDSLATRNPPESFYQATQQAEQQLYRTKSAFIAVASVTFLALFAAAVHLYQPEKPQLVISQQIKPVLEVSTENLVLPLAQVPQQQFNDITLANLSATDAYNIPEPLLEQLLHKLEKSYEKGIVKEIKPILENTPEIREQTDAEITAKLDTLFKITRDRKMLLFNFEWNNISGSLQGKGKFLSRYRLKNQDQWLTREGTALVTAEKGNSSQLEITHLKLQNNTIEQ